MVHRPIDTSLYSPCLQGSASPRDPREQETEACRAGDRSTRHSNCKKKEQNLGLPLVPHQSTTSIMFLCEDQDHLPRPPPPTMFSDEHPPDLLPDVVATPPAAIVLDCGHLFTKAGYSTNLEPAHTLPTCVANHIESVQGGRLGAGRLQMEAAYMGGRETKFDIGVAAQRLRGFPNYNVIYPKKDNVGVIDWNSMERFWWQLLYQYLCVRGEDHNFLLSEPVFQPARNREVTTEVFFEVGRLLSCYS